MRAGILKFAFRMVGVLLLWCLVVGTMIWRFGERDQSEESDCIIVLGAAASANKPSPVFAERIKHAVDLFERGMAPTIIFTGGRGDGASHAESEVAASDAIASGVPENALLKEDRSRTTRRNLVEAGKLMESTGLESAILVSDPLHLKRASWMARDLGIDAVTSPTPTSRYRSPGKKLGFLVREVCLWHHDAVFGE